MRSRIYGLLAAVCLILTVTPAARAEEIVNCPVTGGNIYFDRDTEMVSGCDESVTEADIPKTIEGVPVTAIDEYAFWNCRSLTGVSIPDSVTSIGDFAFSCCAGLTRVSIPNSVTSIGNSVFNSCTGLTGVTIPDSVTSIGNYAFFGCNSLTGVNIPNSITSIGDHAFYGCGSLTDVSIPNGVASIGDYTFINCGSLTRVNIPNSVTSIGESAFFNTGLTDAYYDGTRAEYEAKLLPNISNGNERFLNAVRFKDGASPDANPALPNTAASDHTTFHGTVFLLLAALTLTVRALGRRKKDRES